MRIGSCKFLLLPLLLLGSIAGRGTVSESRKEEIRAIVDSLRQDLRYLSDEEKSYAREYIREELQGSPPDSPPRLFTSVDVILAQADDEAAIQRLTDEYLVSRDSSGPQLAWTGQAKFIELMM